MARALLVGALSTAWTGPGLADDYLPLEVGNRWVYECRGAASDAGWPLCGPPGSDEAARHELVVSEAIPSASKGGPSMRWEGAWWVSSPRRSAPGVFDPTLESQAVGAGVRRGVLRRQGVVTTGET